MNELAEAQKIMSTKKDGGVWALAGYLYQIVGMLGITARLIRGAEDIDANGNIDALFGLANVRGSINVQHESYQQDALLKGIGLMQMDETVFMQFKYSSKPARRITKTDLIEIIATFDESTKNAQDECQHITACILITNREFTSPAEQLWESSSKSKPYRLESIMGWNDADSVRELLRFGKEFGAFESEIQIGINQLVGEVLRKTNENMLLGSSSIHEADFIKSIMGHPDARRLTQAAISSICSDEMQQYAKYIGIYGSAIKRSILSDLITASNNAALIVLNGRGGMGKTVVLWQWLNELTQIKSFDPASELSCTSSDWVVDKVCNWSNILHDHSRRLKTIEDSVERLKIANPGHSLPILFLGLDGLDEDIRSDVKGTIKNTIKWFIKEDEQAKKGLPPRAVLVVTCREFDEFTRNWMPKDLSVGFGETPTVEQIAVNDFSFEEILDVLDNNIFETVISKRISKAIAMSSNSLPTQGLSLRLDPTIVAADHNMLEALRQPIVWRIFTEFDPQKQHAFLDCDLNALNDLTRIFINRFCEKVVDRNKASGLNQEDEILAVLCNIGHHCAQSNTKAFFKIVDDWCRPAYETGIINNLQARRLHREALSAGLIHAEHHQWRWAYDWLLNYLSQEESVQ